MTVFQRSFALFSWAAIQVFSSCFAFSPIVSHQKSVPSSALFASSSVEQHLMELGHKLKLEVYDLDDGIYGFDSKDHKYGIEVVRTSIDIEPTLGIELMELASGSDGRGLVLVSGVFGNAAATEPNIQVGDTITGVFAGDSYKERTTGLNYDWTVDAISQAKEVAAAGDGKITLELDRLVERAPVVIEVDDGQSVQAIQALAGENLRRALMRKGVKLYDRHTKRFDQPFSTGDCAGEGLCGTCLVAVQEGEDLLSPEGGAENLITKGRPLSWRASCRTVVGYGNKGGRIRIRTHPQSAYEDELNPGVKSVSAN